MARAFDFFGKRGRKDEAYFTSFRYNKAPGSFSRRIFFAPGADLFSCLGVQQKDRGMGTSRSPFPSQMGCAGARRQARGAAPEAHRKFEGDVLIAMTVLAAQTGWIDAR